MAKLTQKKLISSFDVVPKRNCKIQIIGDHTALDRTKNNNEEINLNKL